MKVSKSSWHYKLISFFNPTFFHLTKSDCHYFRQLLASMILVVMMVGVCIAAVLGVFCSIVLPFMILNDGLNQLFIDFLDLKWQQIAPIAGILYMGYLVAGVVFAAKYIKRKFEETTKSEEPGVFVSWVKAKKDKICTKVELVD